MVIALCGSHTCSLYKHLSLTDFIVAAIWRSLLGQPGLLMCPACWRTSRTLESVMFAVVDLQNLEVRSILVFLLTEIGGKGNTCIRSCRDWRWGQCLCLFLQRLKVRSILVFDLTESGGEVNTCICSHIDWRWGQSSAANSHSLVLDLTSSHGYGTEEDQVFNVFWIHVQCRRSKFVSSFLGWVSQELTVKSLFGSVKRKGKATPRQEMYFGKLLL